MLVIFVTSTQVNPRVLGGWYTSVRYYPHHIRLMRKLKFLNSFPDDEHIYDSCGGSIIHKNWIVTAAHCLHKNPEQIIVGTEETKDKNPKNIYSISEMKNLTCSKLEKKNGDIGLIKTDRSIEFNDVVKPISLKIPHNWKLIGNYGQVSGFGQQYLNPVSGSALDPEWNVKLKATAGKIENGTCGPYVDALCVKFSGDNSVFHGDSGSGLLGYYKNHTFLLGIVSSGNGRGLIDATVRFINVKVHLKEIKTILASFKDEIDIEPYV